LRLYVAVMHRSAGVAGPFSDSNVLQRPAIVSQRMPRNVNLAVEGDVVGVARHPDERLDPERLAATPTQSSFLLLNLASDVLTADAAQGERDVELLIDTPAVSLAKSR
jgi:hypothetical protein